MNPSERIPAVVVGPNPTALGLVRALAPHGVPVTALESDESEPGVRTRLCDVRLVPTLRDPASLLGELERVADTLPERAVLFLSTDEHVLWAAAAHQRLSERFRLLLPSLAICDDLIRKERFLAVAHERGWPVPRSALLPVEGLVEGIGDAALRYPVIIKPSFKDGAWQDRGLAKAYIARTPEEAKAIAERARGVLVEILAQEFLEGGDDQVYFCLYLAAPEVGPVTFVGRKLLQWPPLRGSTAACEPAEAPELEALTREMFGSLGLEGFASLEVKYGPDGRPWIIEPTVGRPDLQSGVATLNGVNMAWAAYLAAVGRPGEARHALVERRSDVAWLFEPSLWHLLRTRAVDAALWLSLATRKKGYALAAWNDPLVLGAFAGNKLSRVRKRIFS